MGGSGAQKCKLTILSSHLSHRETDPYNINCSYIFGVGWVLLSLSWTTTPGGGRSSHNNVLKAAHKADPVYLI